MRQKRDVTWIKEIVADFPAGRKFYAYEVKSLYIERYGTTYAPTSTRVGYVLRTLTNSGKLHRSSNGIYTVV